MIDRLFKVCNNWNSFHNDITSNLAKNAYQLFLIDKVIKSYIDYKLSSKQNQLKDKSDSHYFKLPYIGNLSHHIKSKLPKFSKELYNENCNFKLVFNWLKIENYFSWKDPIPNDFNSFLVYKFTCANFISTYIGKTCLHFKIRVEGISKRI